MSKPRNDFDPKAYNPVFEWGFLAPKYWGTWLGILIAVPISLLPIGAHKWIAHKIASRLIRTRKRAVQNIRVNLTVCFPDMKEHEIEARVYDTLFTAGVFILRFGLLTLRSKKWLQNQCDLVNEHYLTECTNQQSNVILLVPHSWAIDIPAILLASKGIPVSAMAKKQKNPIGDWLMHRQRIQYGGRVYERSGGIKPFVRSIKEGYLGYYLPDQDHGAELSEFVDFFATTKATLPGLTKLAKLSKSKIIPTFASIDPDTGRYSIEFMPSLELQDTDPEDARGMNKAIEYFVAKAPHQYMWVLQFFRTQKDKRNLYQEFDEKQRHLQ